MTKKILIALTVFLMIGCQEEPQVHYVYLDLRGVLHASQGCKAVTKFHNAQPVRPVPVTDVKTYMLDKVCSQCVDETSLFSLGKIAEANDSLENRVVQKCVVTVDGKRRTIDLSKFNENIDAFVGQMPEATVRMRSKDGKETDIKLKDLSQAYDLGYDYVTIKKLIKER